MSQVNSDYQPPTELLAIVGSVAMTFDQAAPHIRTAIETWRPRAVVSGGADGVDSFARTIAQGEYGLPVIECLPAEKNWASYKKRNLLIAELCTRLVCVRSMASKTYGSGWTADQAEALGKQVTRIEVNPDRVMS